MRSTQVVVLPKSVTPSRVEENLKSTSVSSHICAPALIAILVSVFELPEELFNKMEEAATAHVPQRVVNPSQNWKLGFDIFDEDWPL